MYFSQSGIFAASTRTPVAPTYILYVISIPPLLFATPVTMTNKDMPPEQQLPLPPHPQPVEESFDGLSPIKKLENGQGNDEITTFESPASFVTAHSLASNGHRRNR